MRFKKFLNKKRLIAIFGGLFICSFCFGNDKFQIKTKPDIEIKGSFIAPVMDSLKNPNVSFSNIISVDFSGLYLDSGFCISPVSTDSVINFMARPLTLDYLEIGVGGGYHFYDFFTDFYEHDIISNSYIAYLYKDKFRLQLNLGTFYKFTDFKNQNITNNVFKSTLLIGLLTYWNVTKDFSVYFAFNTIDYFDYQILGSPFFKLGFNMGLNDFLTFGMDYTVKMIDMFAVAAHPSEMLASFYVKVAL